MMEASAGSPQVAIKGQEYMHAALGAQGPVVMPSGAQPAGDKRKNRQN